MTGGVHTYEVSVTYDDERQCNLPPARAWGPKVHSPHVWTTEHDGGWSPLPPSFLCDGVHGFELPKRHSWHIINRIACSCKDLTRP